VLSRFLPIPNFAVKAGDIIGLYVNPPERALVLATDEKKPDSSSDEMRFEIVFSPDALCARMGTLPTGFATTLNLIGARVSCRGGLERPSRRPSTPATAKMLLPARL
jgi:hypothetical protein